MSDNQKKMSAEAGIFGIVGTTIGMTFAIAVAINTIWPDDQKPENPSTILTSPVDCSPQGPSQD